jgi:hypothetical protein
MRSTPQDAVIVLQHIINLFPHDPDTRYVAACAIAEIATEAAENGTIVDPLMGSDYESPVVQQDTPATLPPDPDGQNDDRASWADKAIQTFEMESGTDREDAVADLLCDLMHWVDRNPLPPWSPAAPTSINMTFDEMLDRARRNYASETATEPGWNDGPVASTQPAGLTFDASETATILYALRSLQTDLMDNCADVRAEMLDSEHFADCAPLSEDDIETLCEKINTPSPAALQKAGRL